MQQDVKFRFTSSPRSFSPIPSELLLPRLFQPSVYMPMTVGITVQLSLRLFIPMCSCWGPLRTELAAWHPKEFRPLHLFSPWESWLGKKSCCCDGSCSVLTCDSNFPVGKSQISLPNMKAVLNTTLPLVHCSLAFPIPFYLHQDTGKTFL